MPHGSTAGLSLRALAAALGFACLLALPASSVLAQGDGGGSDWPPLGSEPQDPPSEPYYPPADPYTPPARTPAQPPPPDVPEAKIKAPAWPDDSTFEFGIYDAAGARLATAYYRILQEESNGRKLYRLKYTGRNDSLSESSECVVDRSTLLPLRSTRKVASSASTYYQDVAYQATKIIVRTKNEGSDPMSHEYPVGGDYFDYESLLWLIPQIEFEGATQVRLNLFDTLSELPTSVMVYDNGTAGTSLLGKDIEAHLYSFDVSLTPYRFWTVQKDGREIPVRIDMGNRTFINLVAAGVSKPPKSKTGKKSKGK